MRVNHKIKDWAPGTTLEEVDLHEQDMQALMQHLLAMIKTFAPGKVAHLTIDLNVRMALEIDTPEVIGYSRVNDDKDESGNPKSTFTVTILGNALKKVMEEARQEASNVPTDTPDIQSGGEGNIPDPRS